MTHGEKIRNMTNRELAEFLQCPLHCLTHCAFGEGGECYAPKEGEHFSNKCVRGIELWLEEQSAS